MNRKQFSFVLLALAIIGSAGLILFKRNQQSWISHDAQAGEKVLSNFDYNNVESIHILSSGADFNIVRQDGIWRIQERGRFPANYAVIKDLLLRIRDLKIIQADMVGPSQLPRLELAEPGAKTGTGTMVEFKNSGGKNIASIIVGKRHLRAQSQSDPFRLKGLFDGCYVRLLSQPENVMLISDELAAINPEPQAWLDKSFVKLENLKSVSLMETNGLNLWTLARPAESQPWTLADAEADLGEVLDPIAASQVVEVLPFLTFVDVLPAADAGSRLQHARMLLVETFDHFFYSLRVGAYRDNNQLLSISTRVGTGSGVENPMELKKKLSREQALSSWVYVVETATIQPVLRERAQLIQKKIASR